MMGVGEGRVTGEAGTVGRSLVEVKQLRFCKGTSESPSNGSFEHQKSIAGDKHRAACRAAAESWAVQHTAPHGPPPSTARLRHRSTWPPECQLGVSSCQNTNR